MIYIFLFLNGKQFIIEKNKWYDIDYIFKSKPNTYIYLTKILFFKFLNKFILGNPFIKYSFKTLLAKILYTYNSKKIIVLKTKPKKHYTKIFGHKQKFTRIFF
uniref:Ribosomal protein L21 n=1 Tax=Spumella sp. NIES-1846 TaxID=2490549 RepID=A0A455RFS5_9STRA|nr:ribosomal protein L21 [Spumella sp. NIES-1846]